MKLILSGAKGNLGSHILRYSVNDVIKINRSDWSLLDDGDFTRDDVFIHAAYDIKKLIKSEPTQVMKSNVLATTKALELSRKYNLKKFIYISSCSVYGRSEKATEGTVCIPVSINGKTKLLCEEIVRSFCIYNKIPFLILRVFNTYGGEDRFSVVEKLLRSSKEGTSFTLNNDGQATRDFIHVEDVAKIILHYCSNASKFDCVNVGTGKGVAVKELLDIIESKYSKIIIKDQKEVDEAKSVVCDNRRLLGEYNEELVDIISYLKS